MDHLPEALAAMGEYRQFILWKSEQRGDKVAKFPVDYRTGAVANAHDPAIWLDFETAKTCAGESYGVGFVFTEADPFFFLDIDGCATDAGTWSAVALDIIASLPGAAIEVSQSGSGLHLFGRTAPLDHACKSLPYGLELYTSGRFVALTGDQASGNSGVDLTDALSVLVARYFPEAADSKSAEWTDKADPETKVIETDEELIKKASKSKSAGAVFGNKSSFAALYTADADALAASYPDPEGVRAYDESSADAALAQHLAFWTGRNCERILRIMWTSALRREKWDREDYLPRTILKAIGYQETIYTGGKNKATLEAVAAPLGGVTTGPTVTFEYQYLSATLQVEHFAGCCYVQDIHRVFTPGGSPLKSEQFNATYGGYVFQLDGMGDKTTRKAWEAFTESQVVRYPKAESTCFRPELPTGTLITEENRTLVNTYVPIATERRVGDPAPFVNHVRKLLPDPRDAEIMLAYSAAVVQHKGVKFQWCPLLQGTEGNGKTLLTRCVAFAVGNRYTHIPPATEISEKFNEWLFYKLFIGIEDVYVPEHKREVIEILKPMITNDRLSMRAMQQGQVMGDNRANFMLNSNHKDAVRKTKSDRRFAVFFSAQQTADDLVRDGMDGDYFPDLYEWLRTGGYAIVASYLETYAIPDALNPATQCHRAPVTSSTYEAITASLGGVEQEILEAIEQGRPGFAGGWVSSMALERLLQGMNATRTVPHNKRRDILQAIGYDWHPSLHNGRVNNVVPFDGGKPRLFIKHGHISAGIEDAAGVAKAYQEAQTAAVNGTVAHNINAVQQ